MREDYPQLSSSLADSGLMNTQDRDEIRRLVIEYRRLMCEEQDLEKIDDFFHQRLVGAKHFFDVAEAGYNPLLIEKLYDLAEPLVTQGFPVEGGFNHMKELHFWHGHIAFTSGLIVVASYFDDVNCGISSMVDAFDGYHEVVAFALPVERHAAAS